MSRRTHTWNAWQATITAELASGANSVSVAAIPAEFTAPMYLVVEPDQTGQKEWIRADTINGNTFENLTRNLDGSDGDLTHPINSGIRLVLAKQHLDDLFLDVGDLETADSDHIADASDPHAAAGYLVAADIAGKVDVAGDTMTGELTVPVAAPSGDAVAANKKYVDDSIAALAPVNVVYDTWFGNTLAITESLDMFTQDTELVFPADWNEFLVEMTARASVSNIIGTAGLNMVLSFFPSDLGGGEAYTTGLNVSSDEFTLNAVSVSLNGPVWTPADFLPDRIIKFRGTIGYNQGTFDSTYAGSLKLTRVS